MKLAIMQPYLFPYIGYFQLISSVDTFVIYDDVNFIKGGWINRNNFLIGGTKKLCTFPLEGASANKKINEIQIKSDSKKFIKAVRENYGKTRFFDETFPLVEQIMTFGENNLSSFIENSLYKLADHMKIDVKFILSSSIEKDNALKGSSKVIEICRRMMADTYINSIGGQTLYDKNDFSQKGIDLKFISTDPNICYSQRSTQFIPNLSIIDVLMNVGVDEIKTILTKYALV